jgi:hypothetical protein
MRAKRALDHHRLRVELLEPRLPPGHLLFGTPGLLGFGMLDEFAFLNGNGFETANAAISHRERTVSARALGTPGPTSDGMSNNDFQSSVRARGAAESGTPVPNDAHLPNALGVPQTPLPRERMEDLPEADVLLPKKHPSDRSPPANVRRGPFVSIQVNVDENGQNIVGDAANEPSITINNRVLNVVGLPPGPQPGGRELHRTLGQLPARRVQQVVIGWRQFDTVASNFRQAGYNRSNDAGQTWKAADVLQPGVFRSDPVLASSRDGNIYYMSVRTSPSFATDVFVTDNGGATWSSPNFAYGGDKAWFTVDNTGGMGDGHLYQSWNVAGNDYYPNIFSRSVNESSTWSSPTTIPTRPVFGTLDVGSDGALYVVGAPDQTLNEMVVAKSLNAQDAGQTPIFTSVNVSMGGSMRLSAGPNPGGLLGQAWIAVDRSSGSTQNNIYVLCSVNPPGSDPLDVHFIRSTDGGLTWSAPLRINDDPANSNTWQWFGTMSVAPNGRIDVVWNDTRNSPADNSISETYYAYSLDGGATFSKNIPLTPAWNSHVGWPNQDKIGDYYHMVSENHAAALAYSATFNGEQDVYFLRIGDCNSNYVHDGVDIETGYSQDANDNLIPDECE